LPSRGSGAGEPPPPERRARRRTAQELTATGLIQGILHDWRAVAAFLEADLKSGGKREITMATLDAAVSLARLRGIEIGPAVDSIRRHLERAHGSA